ncbi:hypothetical protein Tco_1012889 [Tanacetum coccineum]
MVGTRTSAIKPHVDDSIKNWVTDHVNQTTADFNEKLKGSEGTSRFSRMGKLEFPKFYGEDVKGWLFRVKKFFAVDNVPDALIKNNNSCMCMECWGHDSFAHALIELEGTVGLKDKLVPQLNQGSKLIEFRLSHVQQRRNTIPESKPDMVTDHDSLAARIRESQSYANKEDHFLKEGLPGQPSSTLGLK